MRLVSRMASGGTRLKAVPILILINVLLFLDTMGLMNSPRFLWVYALSGPGLEAGHWWQLITHAFLHGNLLHLLFNMMGLWFAGRVVERVLGSGRFLVLYVLGALAGGLFQLAFGGAGPLVGASGAVFAVMVAFTTLFPDARITALVLFVPLRLRARYFGLGLTVSSAVLLATGLFPSIGHAAHLGGCVAGFFFARLARTHPSAPTVFGRYAPDANQHDFHQKPG